MFISNKIIKFEKMFSFYSRIMLYCVKIQKTYAKTRNLISRIQKNMQYTMKVFFKVQTLKNILKNNSLKAVLLLDILLMKYLKK